MTTVLRNYYSAPLIYMPLQRATLRMTHYLVRAGATLLAAATFLAGLFVADADAQSGTPVPSWYFGLKGGVSFVDDARLDDKSGATFDGKLGIDTGYHFGGSLGYKPRHTNGFWDYTRFEAEMSFYDTDVKSLKTAAGAVTALGTNDRFGLKTAMINMLIDLPVDQSWTPYVGGGVGGAIAEMESTTLGLANEDDTVLAYQFMTGVYYTPPTFPAAEFGVGYRYLATGEMKFTSSTFNDAIEMDYDSHNLEVGARFYF